MSASPGSSTGMTDVERFKCFIETFVRCGETVLIFLKDVSLTNKDKTISDWQGVKEYLSGQIDKAGNMVIGELDEFSSNYPIVNTMLKLLLPDDISISGYIKSIYPKKNDFICLLDETDENVTKNTLIEIGIEIFQCYEMQMLTVTSEEGPKNAMRVLAIEAAHRVIMYALYENSNNLSSESVAAERKCFDSEIKYIMYSFENFNRKYRVEEFFEKIGIFFGKDGSYKCYSKNVTAEVEYGYRRPFPNETLENIMSSCNHESNVDKYFDPQNFKFKHPSFYTEYLQQLFKGQNNYGEILNETIVRNLLENLKKSLLHNFDNMITLQMENQTLLHDIKNHIQNIKIEGTLCKIKQCIDLSQEKMKTHLDEGFNDVKNHMTNTIKSSILKNGNRPNRKKIHFQLFNPVISFTGRRCELEMLDEALKSENDMAVISQVATITGLGGTGKTELARKYATQYSDNYTHKIFIAVENKENASKSFKELAKQLGIKLLESYKDESDTNRTKERELKAIVNEIFNRISDNGDTTLLILDNAESYEDIKDFVPQRGPQNFKSIFTLITSRYTYWNVGEEGKIIVVPLNKFSSNEALEYLQSELKKAETVGFENLVQILDYLPLALKQAVGYIKEQNEIPQKKSNIFTAANYVSLFETESKILLEKGQNANFERYNKTLLTTWNITFNKISEKGECGKFAITVLNIMAYIIPDNIDIEKVFQTLDDSNLLWNAVNLLGRYSVINIEDGIASVHRLVQEVLRLNLQKNGDEKLIIGITLDLLKKSTKDIEHIVTVWTHASKYGDIIRKYYPNAIYGDDEDTPVHLLAKYRDDEKVLESIIKHVSNLNINKKNLIGKTALYLAVTSNNLKVVKFLLNKGASVNCQNHVEKLIMHSAVSNSNTEIVKLINSHNKDFVKMKNYDNLTPIEMAIIEGNEDIVKVLVPQNNELLVNCARFSKSIDENTFEQLKNDIDKKIKTNSELENLFYLFLATIKGNRDIILFITSHDARINLKNVFNDAYMKELFLENCAHVDAISFNIEKHFKNAIKYRKIHVIECMLKSGYDINAVDEPLQCALESKDDQMFEFLIKNGADIEAKDSDGNTLLHSSLYKNKTQMIKLLIDNGCNINSINKIGETPLDVAIKRYQSNAMKLLSDRGGISKQYKIDLIPLYCAIADENIETIKQSIDDGCSVNSAGNNFDTPFHYALKAVLMHNHYGISVFNALIEKGANIDAKDTDGNTPLHLATAKDNTQVMKLLIENGCNVNLINKSGDTSLDITFRTNAISAFDMLFDNGGISKKQKVNSPSCSIQ